MTEQSQEILDQIDQALRMKPGDEVCCVPNEGVSYPPGLIEAAIGKLREQFPGVRFTIQQPEERP